MLNGSSSKYNSTLVAHPERVQQNLDVLWRLLVMPAYKSASRLVLSWIEDVAHQVGARRGIEGALKTDAFGNYVTDNNDFVLGVPISHWCTNKRSEIQWSLVRKSFWAAAKEGDESPRMRFHHALQMFIHEFVRDDKDLAGRPRSSAHKLVFSLLGAVLENGSNNASRRWLISVCERHASSPDDQPRALLAERRRASSPGRSGAPFLLEDALQLRHGRKWHVGRSLASWLRGAHDDAVRSGRPAGSSAVRSRGSSRLGSAENGDGHA